MYTFVLALSKMYTEERVSDSTSTSSLSQDAQDPYISNSTTTSFTAKKETTKIPALLKYSFMCENVAPGDIVEHKTNSSLGDGDNDGCIRRATVIGIRLELDRVTKTVLLNNGDKLVNSLHVIRRISMRNVYNGEPQWNPVRDWMELSKLYMHPTEDAADGPQRPLEVEIDKKDKTANPHWIKGRKRYDERRRAADITRYRRQKGKEIHTGDIGNFFDWMDPRRIPSEILFLNALYRTCLEIGKLSVFQGLMECTSKEKYQTKKNNLNRDVFKKRQRKGAIALRVLLPFMFFTKFTSAAASCTQYVDGADHTVRRPTKREVKVQEATVKFELDNMHLKIEHCQACRENHLNLVKQTWDGTSTYKCTTCKELPLDYYLDKKLQPVWYERSPGATSWDDFARDDDGKLIVRYDIPEELSSLTWSEELMIRKCAPYIPSVHLSQGYYALSGQCVAFPQNVTDVCTDLPRHPDSIVTYIRQMGNSQTSAVHFDHLKVRRNYVLRALEWLKIHNSEYRDITINHSNLDWMNGKDEADVLKNVRYFHVKGSAPSKAQKPSVSVTQCLNIDSPELEMEFATLGANSWKGGMDPQQEKYMAELVNAAIDSDQSDKLLMFPPHGETPVK